MARGEREPMRAGRPDAGAWRRRERRWAGAFGLTLCMAVLATLVLAGCAPVHPLAGSPTRSPTPVVPACARQRQPPYANIRVSHDAFLAHSEPMLAENPKNPLDLVGGSKFFTDPAHYRFKIGSYTSLDGGCTWTDGGILPGFEQRDLVSDVSFAFDTHNDVYAAVLFTGPGNDGGIAVSASHDGGRTFGPPVTVYHDPSGGVFSDKPWIAVDQTRGTHSGAIYVVWSYDHGPSCGAGNPCEQELAFSRSTDGGKTFSPVLLIEGTAPFCTNPATGRQPGSTRCDAAIGSIPVVGPDGTLAVAFAYYDLLNGHIPTRMLVVTSHDGGVTWNNPVLVATISDVAGAFPPEHYRNESLPAFACDPRTGQLYIAWSDKSSGHADVLFSTSRDGRQTWSSPLRVNDDPPGDGANHFQPQLAVAPDGVVSVSFFDTRVDPRHLWIGVFLTQSVNHGASVLKNVRVTTLSWDPSMDAPVDESHQQFIGDYQGLAADDQFVRPFWNDTRTGSQEIFTALVPSARPA
jgi:hypothetical protein